MSSMTSTIAILPEDMSILLSEIAGRRVADYLFENLSDWGEGRVRAALSQDVRGRSVLEKYPLVSQCQLAEFDAEWPAGGLLIIDARAWFSRAALSAISSRVRASAGSLRFSESTASVYAAHREPMTLAVYVASKDVHQGLFAKARMVEGQGLEHILDPQVITSSGAIACSDLDPMDSPLGLVSFVDLAELERRLLLTRAIAAMKMGVLIRDPATTYLRGELVCASGVEIEPNVTIEGMVILGQGVKIGSNSILRNCQIGDKATINPFSLVEQSSVGARSFVGPYGRIRPGSVIGDNVQIGNYVEIKNSRVGDGSRINHHTFIGDATLDSNVTIGAGTITCNHDGVGTNNTVIEGGAYIGSGCNLVAPLHIGKDAVIGAGSTITHEVPAGKLTLARERQVTVEHWLGPKTRPGKV
jgi:acetyltransferase-like isoleucine patch superfamily enzyme